jgi:hypothetical protein
MADADARRRMAVLATTTALYIFVESGFMVVGPLWATRDLGLDNAGWAFLRSASELGGLISVLLLGILAERLGPRRTSAIALFGGGLLLAALSSGRATVGLIAIYGALVSITFVSFNTLAQRVSTRRQSLANAIYRAAGAAGAIAAPVLGTQAAHMTGSYAPVIRTGALVLGLAGLAILFYPEPEGSHRSRSLSETLSGFGRCFRMPSLLAFIGLTRTFGIAIAAVGAFAALRFTRELHMSEPAFGLLASMVAIGNFVVVLGSGWLVDRLGTSGALSFAWTGCSLASIALGASDSLPVAVAAYALFMPMFSICSIPLSLWATRIAKSAGAAGTSESMVFTVAKVFQSGTTMLVMALLGILEPRLGMQTLMAAGGVLGLAMAIAIVRLGRAQGV